MAGEKDANKQGGLATFLADAVRSGATILDGCRVERIVTATPSRFDDPTAGKRATGVVAELEGGRLIHVTARKCVVLAAGALHSPCVLLRSGVGLPHVGRHLRLHPVTGVLAKFEGRDISLYEARSLNRSGNRRRNRSRNRSRNRH